MPDVAFLSFSNRNNKRRAGSLPAFVRAQKFARMPSPVTAGGTQ